MNEIQKYKRFLVPLLLVGFLLVVLRFGGSLWIKIKTMLAVGGALKQTEDGYKQTLKVDGSEVEINLDTLAASIYYAFYNSKGRSRLNEDETAAILAMQSCPKQQVHNLAAVYSVRFGKVLKDDLISKLSSKEWQSIKYLFE